MNRNAMRILLTCIILAAGGVGLNYASQHKDPLLFTGILFGSALLLGLNTHFLGPIQKPDERAVSRSKDAALDAVRVSAVVGILGGAYAQLLHAPTEAVLLAFGMVIPVIIWWALYIMYNWRDVS